MARARAIPGLDRETAFQEAAARTIEIRAAEMFRHRINVLDTGDIERVHDMRVATRRLRAAMEIFETCFPKREYRRALREVKALADALGERRDPDVRIAALQRLEEALSREERAGVDGLIAELRGRQATGNEHLADALARIDANHLEVRLAGLVASARPKVAA